MEALKAEVVKTGHYKVLALPFGGPLKGKDLDGDFFSERTDPKPHWFPQRPVIWHHGLDRTYGGDPLVGHQEGITKAKDGWWGDIWLDKQNRYFEQIDAMIQSGRMFGSSGTMRHLIKSTTDGELLVWPHIEQTLSPVPRNPYSIVRATKALAEFEEAGIKSDILAVLHQLEDVSSDLRPVTSVLPGDGVAAMAVEAALTKELDTLQHIISRYEENNGHQP